MQDLAVATDGTTSDYITGDQDKLNGKIQYTRHKTQDKAIDQLVGVHTERTAKITDSAIPDFSPRELSMSAGWYSDGGDSGSRDFETWVAGKIGSVDNPDEAI